MSHPASNQTNQPTNEPIKRLAQRCQRREKNLKKRQVVDVLDLLAIGSLVYVLYVSRDVCVCEKERDTNRETYIGTACSCSLERLSTGVTINTSSSSRHRLCQYGDGKGAGNCNGHNGQDSGGRVTAARQELAHPEAAGADLQAIEQQVGVGGEGGGKGGCNLEDPRANVNADGGICVCVRS
jgi:hypothetical protein